MASRYCPRRGDVVWLSFDPKAGHEQAWNRPALILSPEPYNRKVGLAILCPITAHKKGYPFEVAVPLGLNVSGVVLADQVKSLDWKALEVRFACELPQETLREVMAKLGSLLEI